MWNATVDGRPLRFHLAGINNQNFLMRDEETGSWWQQVTGEAIHGPLAGKRLEPIHHDELSFAVWKREQPHGRVLRPDPRVAAQYEPADWEERYAKLPVFTPVSANEPLAPRTLVIGITAGGQARAYPLPELQKQSPILDMLGGVPVLLVLGDDGKSVRAFDRTIRSSTGDDRVLELFVEPGVRPLQLVDAETGSTWDFTGRAIRGPLAGTQLARVTLLKDYWFDWKTYHPQTTIYALGDRAGRPAQ